ncbi:hypothetical protein V529_31870 [Bacillus velezensis SQR9]|nr:hypothetical protein V529_31870 [Bacillus velezensis SQR9]
MAGFPMDLKINFTESLLSYFMPICGMNILIGSKLKCDKEM